MLLTDVFLSLKQKIRKNFSEFKKCQEKILDTVMEIRYDTQGGYRWKSL